MREATPGLDLSEADARLISAAPDMLGALSELLAEVDETFLEEASEHGHYRRPDTFGMTLARAAIAKAIGNE